MVNLKMSLNDFVINTLEIESLKMPKLRSIIKKYLRPINVEEFVLREGGKEMVKISDCESG